MTRSNRTGLRRLAAAMALPYFGFWAAVGVLNYNTQDLVDQSLFWGAFLPALLLVAVVAARWVYNGFRPV